MRTMKLTILALAVAAALPSRAADPNPDPKKELQALKKELQALEAKVAELEQKSKAAPAAAPAGMTPEQLQDFNRIAVKAEALEDGRDAAGLKGFKVSGYVDPTYVYNVNKQRANFQFVVPIQKEPYSYDNSYFGTAALDLQKEMDSGTKWRLTIIPKRSSGDVFNENSIVHEATVFIPLGSLSTKLFAGQVPDWSGYEFMPPTQNKLITHNLLFDFTIPAAYTGAGIELVRGKWDLKFMLANFNASIRNIGEHIPMFVFRGDYTGGEYWGFGFAGAEGYKTNFRAQPNPADPTNPALDGKDSRYDTLEVDGFYTRGDLTLNAHLAFGQQQKAAITADPTTGELRTAQWFGASLLAAYKFTPRVEGALRGDFIYNQKNGGGLLDYTVADAGNGIGPDQNGGDPEKGASRFAISAGLSYALNSNVVLKGEYRFDGATKDVFGNKDVLLGGPNPSFGKTNSLISTAVVVSF